MGLRPNRLSWFSFLLSAAVAAVVLAPASPAAADAKRVSGTACFFRDTFSHLSHSREGQFLNTSNTTQQVICPIIKDTLASPVAVFVRASNSVDATSCRVVRRNGGGALSFFSATGTTQYSDGSKDVNWSTPIVAPTGSTFTVRCSVPANGAIYAVQSAED